MANAVCLTVRHHGRDFIAWEGCMDVSHIYAMIILLFLWALSTGTAAAEKRDRLSSSGWPVAARPTSSTSKVTDADASSSPAFLDGPGSPLGSFSSSDSDSDDQNSSEESCSIIRNEAILENELPDASSAERLRFLSGKKGDVCRASIQLRHYLDWIKIHELIENELELGDHVVSGDLDLDHWNTACAIAIECCNEKCNVPLPRVIRTYQVNGSNVCDFRGHRIFHIIPGLMDDKLVKTSTYALATALYLNRQLCRTDFERVTVCVDVRPGKGWPNISALRLIPFMKETTKLLLSLFPERLERCLLYPVPPAFLWIWNIMQRCLEPATKEKICLLPGGGTIESPPPTDKICEYIGLEVAELLEHSRRATFKA